jgi:methyl-accepting chemotaxis protein
METACSFDEAGQKLIKSAIDQCFRVAIHAADITGRIEDISKHISNQSSEIAVVDDAVREMVASNTEIAANAHDLEAKTANVNARMEHTQASIKRAMGNIFALVDDVSAIETRLPPLQDALSQVFHSSTEIKKIAGLTNILALNATIEAARAGDAGKGFAIVAHEVKELSRQTTLAVQSIQSTVENLRRQMDDLIQQSHSAMSQATSARAGGGAIGQAIGEMDGVVHDVAEVAEKISSISSSAENNRQRCGTVAEEATKIDQTEQASKADAQQITEEAFLLIQLSAELNYALAVTGVETNDTPFIDAVVDTAHKISKALNDAVDAGDIDIDSMFDENYIQMPDIQPPKYTTRWLPLIERLVPQICEPVSLLTPDVVLCTITDRNAYMPVNNLRHSKPPTKDPVWNATFSRYRIRHLDRVSAVIGKSTKPFLVMIFRRRLGDKTQVLRDVSAPIFIRGRLWGNVRMLIRTEHPDSAG